MKRSNQFLFVFAIALTLGGLSSCNKCTETGTVTIGEDVQFFTITYKEPDGTNYIDSIFNLGNVNVLFTSDLTSNAVPYAYVEDFSDGKLGPIPFSTNPTKARLGVPYDYTYYIKRDTYGWDTLRVKFVATVDQCKQYWAEISYFLNGDPLPDHDGEEIANIEVIIP